MIGPDEKFGLAINFADEAAEEVNK